MCMMAVKSILDLLTFIPKHIIDRDICMVAIMEDYHILKYMVDLTTYVGRNISMDIFDKEFFIDIVKMNPYALEFVPIN